MPEVEYVHKVILEAELLGRENEQLALPISYSMNYFTDFSYIKALNEHSLSRLERFPTRQLEGDADNSSSIRDVLNLLEKLGCEVGAADFQLKAYQHGIGAMRQ